MAQFELQVALKYLIPRKRSLSTALISGMSVLVISLIIWLVLVFLSVTKGIEQNWLHKLTSLHAPIRLHPTDAYYNSYYYQIDRFAFASHYALKTIGEKAESAQSDPFDKNLDAEFPPFLPEPDQLRGGSLCDPVKIAYQELEQLKKEIPDLSFQDYEIGGALLRLNLEENGSHLSQMSYLLSLTEQNPHLASLIVEKGGEGSETPIYLPKSYRESGARVGHVGSLSYLAPTAGSVQEQHIPIRIAGFYDSGVLPVGNKCLLVPVEVTRTILSASQTFSPDGTPTNGIFVWIKNLKSAEEVREKIAAAFEKAGIGSYWNIKTYEEFEFSKDLLLQFQSDRTLFLLIAAIILIVACCNIISLLVLLVNDKKREIAILLSMGATKRSISGIFAFCGVAMGTVSCLIGTLAALLTLRHLDSLVSFLSALQGRAAFNPLFFGQRLPHQFSYEAFLFVLVATPLLSLAAGLIPALKASRICPSAILRSE